MAPFTLLLGIPIDLRLQISSQFDFQVHQLILVKCKIDLRKHPLLSRSQEKYLEGSSRPTNYVLERAEEGLRGWQAGR